MAVLSKTIENGVLTLTVQGFAPIVVDPADYPQELLNQAALHGFAQKYGDAAALSAGSTPAEKHAAILAVVDHHKATGEWNRKGGAGGDGTSGDGLLVGAIMEFQNIDRDTARGLVAQMDKKVQAAMRGSAELKPIIERLRVARAPKAPVGFDAAAVLAGLMKPRAPVDEAPM